MKYNKDFGIIKQFYAKVSMRTYCKYIRKEREREREEKSGSKYEKQEKNEEGNKNK